MSEKMNDGGPAFPVPTPVLAGGYRMIVEGGMSLRDYFAAKAMEGLLAHGKRQTEAGENADLKWYAQSAYIIADAMLAAREGGSRE